MGAISRVVTPHINILSILLYAGLSVPAMLLNKLLINRMFFDYTIVMLMVQMALVLCVVEVARLLNFVSIAPYTLDRGKDMIIPSILYCFNSYIALIALQGLNMPIYGTVKRWLPLVTLYVGYFVLKKPKPSRGAVTGVTMVAFGAVMASFYTFSFDFYSYAYALLSLICHALFTNMIERLVLQSQYSTIDVIYLNSFNSLIVFLIADVIYDEIRDAFMYTLTSASADFWFAFIADVVVGAALNCAFLLCITKNSALTTAVVANTKSIAQNMVGYMFSVYLLYELVPSFWNIVGMLVATAGCVFYTQAKSKEIGGGIGGIGGIGGVGGSGGIRNGMERA